MFCSLARKSVTLSQLYGMDYLGQICSVDGETKLADDDDGYRKFDVRSRRKSYLLPSGAFVCVKRCPGTDDASRFVCEYHVQEELEVYLDDGDVQSSQTHTHPVCQKPIFFVLARARHGSPDHCNAFKTRAGTGCAGCKACLRTSATSSGPRRAT